MSYSLVKKGLDLFADDLKPLGATDEKKIKKKKATAAPAAADPMKMISSNRSGVKKQLRKIKIAAEKEREVKRKQKLSKGDTFKPKVDKDHTDAALASIERLSCIASVGTTGIIEKVFEHQRGRLSKNILQEDMPESKAATFTDQDFQNFQDEYFG